MFAAIIKCLQFAFPGGPESVRDKSVRKVEERLHSMKDKLFVFIRGGPCTPLSGLDHMFCGIHGKKENCPGPSFREEYSFLPLMLEEVRMVVSSVDGLVLADLLDAA